MGKVKALWQAERDARWQQHYDDWCMDNLGGGEASGRDHDEASNYADEQMEEEDEANGRFGVGA